MSTPEAFADTIRRAIAEQRAGRTDLAEQLIDSVLSVHVDHGPALALKGELALRRHDLALAIQSFRRLVDIQPGNRPAHAKLAASLFHSRRFQDAFDILNKFVPWIENIDAQLLLVKSAIACGKLEEAEEALRQIERAPQTAANIEFHSGLLSQRRGNFRDALQSFGRAADLANDNTEVLRYLLDSALKLEDSVELALVLDRVCRKFDVEHTNWPLLFSATAALAKLGRVEEAERYSFIFYDTNKDPRHLRVNQINRHVADENFAEAVRVLDAAVPRFTAVGQGDYIRPGASGAPQVVRRLVVNNGHHMLRNMDADDISSECSLPVTLLDLNKVPAHEYAAQDTIVLLPNVISAEIAHAIKRACAACIVVAWDWDIHHSYLWSALLVQVVDAFFHTHVTAIDYLSKWDSRNALAGRVPQAVVQWPQHELSELYEQHRDQSRSDQLSSRFTFYAVARRRNNFLARVGLEWPEADVGIDGEGVTYHHRGAAERFLSWRRHKTSLALPVCGDLSSRFFDALAAGQVPIVPHDILDFDSVVTPAEQRMLPIIRLNEYSVDALRAAHAEAVRRFDIGGEAQARDRHKYALERHMLKHRIREMVLKTAAKCNLVLEQG